MKIVIAVFPHYFNGMAAAVKVQTKYLLDRGHEILLLYLKNESLRKGLADLEHPLLQKKEIFLFRGLRGIFGIFQFRKAVNEYKPDVILCHNRLSSILMFGGYKFPIVWNYHSIGTTNFKRVAGKFDSVFPISKIAVNRLKKLYSKKRIEQLPNVVEFDKFKYIDFKKSFGKSPVIGILGRLAKYKGPDNFVRALAILKNKGLAFKAVIGGIGEMEGELKKFVRENDLEKNVQFLGWIDVEKRDSFFRDIDVFCFSTREETFGVVVIEALFSKRIVVATDVAVVSEFEHKKELFNVGVSTPEKIADGLEWVLTHGKEALQMARGGYNAVQKYTPEKVIPKLEKILKDAIAKFENKKG